MKHYNVVCAIIKNDNDEIFVCKRGPGRALEGYFEFPGGKIELNESKKEAIVREIKEELNSIVEPIKYIGESSYTYKNIQPFDDFSITLYGFLCKLVSGSLELSEHTDSKWVRIEDLDKINFAKADIPFIQLLKKE